MSAGTPPVSECCTQCPHVDEFHGNCTHELRQTIVQELSSASEANCPLFSGIRADAMRQLAEQTRRDDDR